MAVPTLPLPNRGRGAMLIARFTEVESGRNPDRPELGKALPSPRSPGRRSSSPSSTGCPGTPPSCWRSGTAASASPPSTCRRRTTSPSGSWRWWRSKSGRRSRNAPRRRWPWPGAAVCGSATPTAPRRSGGLARAVRRCARPSPATLIEMQGLGAGGGGHSVRRREEPPSDRGRAEWPRHADPAGRLLARVDSGEPARPARIRRRAARVQDDVARGVNSVV